MFKDSIEHLFKKIISLDYLANRSQLTHIDGAFSEFKPVKIWVPQGSLLGPRLFITYVNDLPDSIKSGDVYMYANDTTIYTIGNTTDEVPIPLQVILDQLQTWCQKNRLIIHEGKCVYYTCMLWLCEALAQII